MLNYIKREFTIDGILINSFLGLNAVMLAPHAVAILSCMAVAT